MRWSILKKKKKNQSNCLQWKSRLTQNIKTTKSETPPQAFYDSISLTFQLTNFMSNPPTSLFRTYANENHTWNNWKKNQQNFQIPGRCPCSHHLQGLHSNILLTSHIPFSPLRSKISTHELIYQWYKIQELTLQNSILIIGL